jgi:predicted nucleic acid-binding protein
VGAQGPSAVTLDTGALIAVESGNRRVLALLETAAGDGAPVYLPSAVIAEVWRGGSGRQARLAAFLKNGLRFGHVEIVDLDYSAAQQVGILRSTITDGRVSITDVMVAWCVKRRGGIACTSDPTDLRRFLSEEQILAI